MKKIIRKTGNSLGIVFNTEERQILNLKEGDVVSFQFEKDISAQDLIDVVEEYK